MSLVMGLTIEFDNDGLPFFGLDGQAISPQEGITALRKKIIQEQKIGAEAATRYLMEVTGKGRAMVHKWLTGTATPQAEDYLRLKKRFSL